MYLNNSVPENWACSTAHPPTHPHLMRQKGLLPSSCWAARRGRWEGRAGKKWFCGTGRAWQEQGKASQERNDWHSWGRGIDAPWLTHSFKHHQLVRRQTEKGIPRGFLRKYFFLSYALSEVDLDQLSFLSKLSINNFHWFIDKFV